MEPILLVPHRPSIYSVTPPIDPAAYILLWAFLVLYNCCFPPASTKGGSKFADIIRPFSSLASLSIDGAAVYSIDIF